MDFNLDFKDETTYEALTHVITINDSSNWVARVRFDNNWSGNEYGERFIHRFHELVTPWKLNRPKANIRATYESSNGTEFEDFPYQVELLADVKNNRTAWGDLSLFQHIINELVKSPVLGFNVKDVFKDDVDKPHATTPIFEHPTHFKAETTEDSGANDGIIKVFALGGTGPFQARIDGGTWEDLVTENIGGNDVDTYSFTGLTTGGGSESDGSYEIRVRDSRSPRVVGKVKYYQV